MEAVRFEALKDSHSKHLADVIEQKEATLSKMDGERSDLLRQLSTAQAELQATRRELEVSAGAALPLTPLSTRRAAPVP